jgi:hypothetical protein
VNGQDAYTGQLVPVNIQNAPRDVVGCLTQGLGSGGPDFAHAAAGWIFDQEATEVFAAFDSTWSGHYELNNTGKTSPTLKVGSSTGGEPQAIATSGGARTIVRRLTPLECERLMGWPDNYTAHGISDEGELVDIANTNRYRICGNGIVATVTEWIGHRLPTVTGSGDDETMTSSSNRSRPATSQT